MKIKNQNGDAVIEKKYKVLIYIKNDQRFITFLHNHERCLKSNETKYLKDITCDTFERAKDIITSEIGFFSIYTLLYIYQRQKILLMRSQKKYFLYGNTDIHTSILYTFTDENLILYNSCRGIDRCILIFCTHAYIKYLEKSYI